MFAFNNLLGRFDFMVLDEVLELSLDTAGKEDVITLLKNKAKDTGTILCISHDSTIKDSFNSVLSVKLENEISYIE
jgi:DNA repair exonuclease SbcCD ATPase subunit